jgi:cytidylate kinase
MATRVDDDASSALDKAAADLADIDVGGITTEAVATMRRFIPVDKGRARDSIQGATANGRAVVTVGGPSAPYASVLAATHPSRFVRRTDEVMERRTTELLTEAWDDIAQRNGLT